MNRERWQAVTARPALRWRRIRVPHAKGAIPPAVSKANGTVGENRGAFQTTLEICAEQTLFAGSRNTNGEAVAQDTVDEIPFGHHSGVARLSLEQELTGDVVDQIACQLLFTKSDHQAPPERVGFGTTPRALPRAVTLRPFSPVWSRRLSRVRMSSTSRPKSCLR